MGWKVTYTDTSGAERDSRDCGEDEAAAIQMAYDLEVHQRCTVLHVVNDRGHKLSDAELRSQIKLLKASGTA